MHFSPSNIFDHKDKALPAKGGETIIASLTLSGGGWNVKILPDMMLCEDVDVWTACRILNEMVS